MFTCISCRVAFDTAAEQRNHFSADWHRYNMKRRVANLPPVAATAFNEKVLERREQNAVRSDPRDMFCTSCNKSFSSENAYRSHIQSRKHRDRETAQQGQNRDERGVTAHRPLSQRSVMIEEEQNSLSDPASDNENIENRIAISRRRIQPTDCIFCPERNSSIPAALSHMSRYHSFFIPDPECLADVAGLLSYLGEKVAIGNICIYCPDGGKEFGSLEAVRKHMVDKGHCKIAYDTDEDRAELLDFYDYGALGKDGSDWEDEEMESVGHMVVDDEEDPRSAVLASDGLSLVLPSGRTLGHRSLRVYYSQRLRPSPTINTARELISAKVSHVRKRLADPSQAVVPVAGGHGAFGKGLQVIKARNAGEAAWAKRQGRSFKDQRVKENLRTRVGFVHNSQKHFRDPLLQ